MCIKLHIRTSSTETHSQRVLCILFVAFWVFVWNRWELIVLPNWMSFREICQIKMSLQSSFRKPPTCSCDKCCSHIEQMCHKKYKYESELLTLPTAHNDKMIILSLIMIGNYNTCFNYIMQTEICDETTRTFSSSIPVIHYLPSSHFHRYHITCMAPVWISMFLVSLTSLDTFN